MKFDIICADPCWAFSDKLLMSKVKRGAASNYGTLTDKDIINLDVKNIITDDALLALWIPSSKLQVGLDCLKSWGFEQKQTWIWVKTKKDPLQSILTKIFKSIPLINKNNQINLTRTGQKQWFKNLMRLMFESFDINNILSFFMGHYFRQTHEIVLIGVRGKMASKIQNKSQRSVFLGPIGKHSEKPEALQDMLEKMYPLNDPKNPIKAVELFARRSRKGWICRGNECESSKNEDIRDSIEKLKNE